jgi:hypothetical protein
MKRFRVLSALVLLVAGPAYSQDETSTEFAGRLANFVRSSWDHGVPYSDSRAFGVEALPYLHTWLRSDALRPHWSTIVWMIGYIGEPADFDSLRAFLEERFTGEVDEETFGALLSAVHVLGHIAVRSTPAMTYLRAGTNPAFFSRIRWSHRSASGSTVRLLLSKLAINAISSTGTPEAEQALKELEQSPHSDRQIFNITEGLARHKEISRRGRAEYFRNVGRSRNR